MHTLSTTSLRRWGIWGWLRVAFGLLMAPVLGQAQAPAWQQAFSGGTMFPVAGSASPRATATDASGNVFVTGIFDRQMAFGNTMLTSLGSDDIFLAKWSPATATWVWAVSGGSSGIEGGLGLAVSGNQVYITGLFSGSITLAGTTLTSGGNTDLFLAKYVDNGSTVSNGWAMRDGGPGIDHGRALAVSGPNIYLAGVCGTQATVAGMALGHSGDDDILVAKYVDNGSTVSNGWAVRGGGLRADMANGIAVSGNNVYAVGSFTGAGTIAGTSLIGAGDKQLFVVKYVDQGSTAANGWAVQGGGTGIDVAHGVVASGTNVYVTGQFGSRAGAVIAGTPLAGHGMTFDLNDMFLAKYVDQGSTVANGWAIGEGGTGDDVAYALAMDGTSLYVTGTFLSRPGTELAGTVIAGNPVANTSEHDAFVARYTDAGSSPTNGWAARAGGNGDDAGYGVAVAGTRVHTCMSSVAGFVAGSLRADAGGSVVGQQDAATGTWLQLGWALRSVGSSRITASATDASGNVYVAGNFTRQVAFGQVPLANAGSTDVFLAKWSPATNTWLWATSAGSLGPEQVTDIAVSGSNIYLTGSFGWGSTIIAGTALSGSPQGTTGYLAKYVDRGSFVGNGWAIPLSATVSGVAATANNVYVTGEFGTPSLTVAGATLSSAGLSDIFVAKYVDQGNLPDPAWALRAGSPGADGAYDVAVQGANVYLTGYFASTTGAVIAGTALAGAGGPDMFVAKYLDNETAAGNGWAISGGGMSNDRGRSLVVQDSIVYVAGHFDSAGGARFAGPLLPGAGFNDGFLVKYEDQGTTVDVGWATSGGGPGEDYFYKVVANGANVYVAGEYAAGASVAGTALAFQGATDALLAKYVDAGSSFVNAWAALGGGGDADAGTTIALSGTAVFLGGWATTPAAFGAFSLPLTPTGELGYLARLDDQGPTLATIATSGVGGTSVTLTGTNLGGATSVTFTGATGPIVVSTGLVVNATGTQLTVPLPAGASTGPVSVSTTGGTSGSVLLSLLPPPTISSFTPISSPVGASVTVTGTNFTGTTAVLLNGVAIGGFTVVNATTISFVVPAGASSGPLTVTTLTGTTTSTAPLCVPYVASAPAAARCGTGSLTLTASGAPTGGSYAWYDVATGGTAISGATGPTYTTPSLTANALYYVAISTGTGSAACEGARTAVTATINAVPSVSIAASGATSFCQGGSVVLTASGADTYLWSTGATTASITVSTTGTYTVTGTTTAGGCSAASAMPVSVEPLPATPVITQGPTGTLTSSAASGNQWYLGGTAIQGATGATYVVTSAAGNGNYTVVMTSAMGCASAPSAVVAVMITGTTRSNLLPGLQVLPNPAHDHATVLLPHLSGTVATLELVDALGRVVLTQPVTTPAAGRQELHLPGIGAGVYALRLMAADAMATCRLVVN